MWRFWKGRRPVVRVKISIGLYQEFEFDGDAPPTEVFNRVDQWYAKLGDPNMQAHVDAITGKLETVAIVLDTITQRLNATGTSPVA